MWRNLHANAEDSGDSDELVDPPKVEEKLGAVPSGLSTDAEVAKRYVWESKADGSFAISDDTWNEPLGRGTEISIYFFCMYFVTSSFCVMSSKVSDFESYCPVWAVHTGLPVDQYVDRPLSGGTTDWGCFCPITIRNRLKKENKNLESDCSSPTRSVACGRFLLPAQGEETSPRVGRRNEVTTPKYTARYQHTVPYQAEPGMPVWYEDEETEEDASEKKPKTKTVKETTYDWEDFSEEKPLAWSHFTAEGDVEFKALLFVPPKAPHDLYESYYNTNKSNLKLYVRRVFISDEFDELLPKYLSFLKVSKQHSQVVSEVTWWDRFVILAISFVKLFYLQGLVDSDTLPLNVSREMLQQHNSLKTIKKKLIRKALDMIRRIADEDPDEFHNKDKTG
ncbi:hypothetical protein BHE74_00023597 [Ensete ventricosum]|nr:hypothetical protein BHE74_00023597 [Ensete ventricosum]